jgi:hypothetical protein
MNILAFMSDVCWIWAAAVLILAGIFFFLTKEATFDVGEHLEQPDCKWHNKRFLVLCNPIGGRRQGKLIVERVVKPICAANAISVEVVYTERVMHAFELGRNNDFSLYDGVLLVSGDGLIHEFLNGLAARVRERSLPSDSDSDPDDDFVTFLSTFPPIGIVPGGTSNGVATTLHSSSPVQAMQAIIRGAAKPVDMYHVTSPGKHMSRSVDHSSSASIGGGRVIDVWDVHYFSWAIVADADDIMERKVSIVAC